MLTSAIELSQQSIRVYLRHKKTLAAILWGSFDGSDLVFPFLVSLVHCFFKAWLLPPYNQFYQYQAQLVS